MGPEVKRENVSTAPIESLGGPTAQFLQALLQDPSQAFQGLAPTSDLQRQVGATFQGILQNRAPGQEVITAALPGFQENLQRSADVLRQSGPRFASNTERLVGEQSRRSLQDFNLFQQQVLEMGQNRQLQALLGAGQFALGGQGQQLSALLPLLQTALTAGGAQAGPVITESPGFLGGTLLPFLGTGATIAATAFGGPAAGAAVSGFTSGGGDPRITRPNPGGTFA